MSSEELKPCPCGGKSHGVVTNNTHHDPWSRAVTPITWPLTEVFIIEKCWKCGKENIPDSILDQIAKRADEVKKMSWSEVIRIGDMDQYVYRLYVALRNSNKPAGAVTRLSRDGDSTLAKMLREKDEINKAYPLMELHKAGCMEDLDYLRSVFRLSVILDRLQEAPDDDQAGCLGFRTLSEIRDESRRLIADAGARPGV